MAYLILEDGTIFEGEGFGSQDTVIGEIVFNTGMTGYQEILTDPSYAGQVVTMTYPLIGNYGINSVDFESNGPKVFGFVVKEYASHPSHWQEEMSINDYLIKHNIPGISGIDTRMLTKIIRTSGAMKCMITNEEISEELKEKIDAFIFPAGIVSEVSVREIKEYKGTGSKVGIIDLGLKDGIVKQLQNLGCNVIVFPHDTVKKDLDPYQLDVLLFSNGPGDPKEAKFAIKLAKDCLGSMPMWGICLGHQVLALALGADTYKLKFGHRGANHPVIELETSKVYMSSQNHGYAVDKDSINEDVKITYMNINDNTVEGISSKKYNVKSVQFHPEEGPGPEDGHYIFQKWNSSLK